MKISMFKGVLPEPAGETTINELLNNIKFGKWEKEVKKIQVCQNEDERKDLKRYLPSCTIAGTFRKRNEASLSELSGFICIDMDGFDFTKYGKIKEDPYTYSCFKSVSGTGIAVIVKINKESFKECFRWLQKYYFDSYSIVIDPAPSNIASLRFISCDPELFINEKSKESKKLKEFKKPTSLPIVLGNEDLDDIIRQMQHKGVNIASSYEDYLHISFAIAGHHGEFGRKWFHAICQQDVKYNSKHANKQYDIALKRNRHGVGIGTLYYFMKNAGVELPSKSRELVSTVALHKKSGKSKESVVKLMELNGVNENDAKNFVSEIYERSDITLKTLSVDTEHLIENVVQFMKVNHQFKKNEITKIVEDAGKELTKERLNTIYLMARANFNTPQVNYEIIERIIFSEFTETYNPITKYIDNNRHRNTIGNIDKICQSIESDTPHKDFFIKRWLIAIIAAYDGYPVRYVLALTGGQNTGKTEFFRRLLPRELKKYYAESKLDAGKDDDILMCQKLIVMDDEMGGKSKQDEKRFKELTSKAIFSLRAPYGRNNEDFKRLAILCGTSNDSQLINDTTGNTRIFPIHVISINHEMYNSVDKDELFMELVSEYEKMNGYELSKTELALLSDISIRHTESSIERELIDMHFKNGTDGGGYVENLTATEIKDYIETNTRQKILSIRKFNQELRSAFGESISIRDGKNVKRVYKVIKIKDIGQIIEYVAPF